MSSISRFAGSVVLESVPPGQLPAAPTARFASMYMGECMSDAVGMEATAAPSR